jgi:hypothetical protein
MCVAGDRRNTVDCESFLVFQETIAGQKVEPQDHWQQIDEPHREHGDFDMNCLSIFTATTLLPPVIDFALHQ